MNAVKIPYFKKFVIKNGVEVSRVQKPRSELVTRITRKNERDEMKPVLNDNKKAKKTSLFS